MAWLTFRRTYSSRTAYTGSMTDVTRVGIIGTGWVGSSVAISTLHAGLAQELLLHDVRTAIAEGEAMDLAHGAAFYPAWAETIDSTVDDRRGRLADIGARACEHLASAGLAATTELREGAPADQLIRAADADGADLIVLGSRGLSTLPRLLLGSVARSVLLHAPVSVLIIRDAKERVTTDEPTRAPTGAAAG